MSYLLILSKGDERIVTEFDSMEAAFDAADPRLREGYVAQVTDADGVVLYTQALQGDMIQVFKGDPASSSELPADSAVAGETSVVSKVGGAAICLVVFYIALQVAEAYFKN